MQPLVDLLFFLCLSLLQFAALHHEFSLMADKKLVYTTVAASIHYKADLFAVELWKKEGLSTWTGLIHSRMEFLDKEVIPILKLIAGTVDAFEDTIKNNPDLAENLGATDKDPKQVPEIGAQHLWRFIPTLLLDRLYDAALVSAAPRDTIELRRHPLFRLTAPKIKTTSIAKEYLGWSMQELHKLMVTYAALRPAVGDLVVPDVGPLERLDPPSVTEAPQSPPPSTPSSAPLPQRAAPPPGPASQQGTSAANVSRFEVNEMNEAVSYGAGIFGAFSEAARADAHRVATNLWGLAASCFYLIRGKQDKAGERFEKAFA
jgi:hypothetical protein